MSKRIAHIDMDSFFVSIERRDNPELCNRPVVVGGTKGRGVVSSASYEARVFGVHSGMPIGRARQLCPDLLAVAPSSGKYSEASRQVKAILQNYSPDVDFTSIDEGYFDLTGTQRLFGPPLATAEIVCAEVRQVTGCDASVGISGNRLCSKIASKFAKPAGVIEVAPGQEKLFLAPLPLSLMPGAGGKTGKRMEQFGVKRIGQLVTVGEQVLRSTFGLAGQDMYLNAMGGKTAPRKSYRDLPRKSVGHERTFGQDVTDFAFLERVIFRLGERVCRTLRDEKMVCRCVTLKVRLADFRTFTRSRTMLSATDSDYEIFRECRELLREFKLPRISVRLVGVSLSRLSVECQWGLFSNAAKQWQLYRGIDKIRDTYGFEAVVNGFVFGDESSSRYQGKTFNSFQAPPEEP